MTKQPKRRIEDGEKKVDCECPIVLPPTSYCTSLYLYSNVVERKERNWSSCCLSRFLGRKHQHLWFPLTFSGNIFTYVEAYLGGICAFWYRTPGNDSQLVTIAINNDYVLNRNWCSYYFSTPGLTHITLLNKFVAEAVVAQGVSILNTIWCVPS